jgi:hypothetical protein
VTNAAGGLHGAGAGSAGAPDEAGEAAVGSAERPRGGSADARAPESTERPRGGSADARAPESTDVPAEEYLSFPGGRVHLLRGGA